MKFTAYPNGVMTFVQTTWYSRFSDSLLSLPPFLIPPNRKYQGCEINLKKWNLFAQLPLLLWTHCWIFSSPFSFKRQPFFEVPFCDRILGIFDLPSPFS